VDVPLYNNVYYHMYVRAYAGLAPIPKAAGEATQRSNDRDAWYAGAPSHRGQVMNYHNLLARYPKFKPVVRGPIWMPENDADDDYGRFVGTITSVDCSESCQVATAITVRWYDATGRLQGERRYPIRSDSQLNISGTYI
jgi:hypothetical protein